MNGFKRIGVLLGMIGALLWLAVMTAADAAGAEQPAKIFTLHGPAFAQMTQQTWDEAWKLPGVVTGPAKAPAIVIFFDPNCPYCAHFWQTMHVMESFMRIRWVPVALVRPSSLAMAAHIVYSRHPRQMLAMNESHFNFKTHRGGVLPAFRVSPARAAAIHQSTELLVRNIGALPATLYPSKTGINVSFGTPNSQQVTLIVKTAIGAWTSGRMP